MQKVAATSLLCVAVLLAGCETSSGLSYREVGAHTYTQLVYAQYANQVIESGTREICFPITLGVAQIGEVAPPPELTASITESTNLVSRIIELPMPGEDYSHYSGRGNTEDKETFLRRRTETLRGLGQQLGADYVLMIGGNIDTRTSQTPLILLNIATLPAFFVPAERVYVDAKANGVLIEARSGRILGFVSGASATKGYTPSAFKEQRRESLSLEQKAVLCNQIAESLAEKLEAMK